MTTPAQHELTLTRILDAPRALVFRIWTDPAHLAQWWGPHGFTTSEVELDLRPGGALSLRMAGHGFDDKMFGEYVEIVPPERLVFKSFLKNTEGAPFLELLNTVTFTERAGKTTLTLNARVLFAGAGADGPLSGMAEGWDQSLERLTAYVETTNGQLSHS